MKVGSKVQITTPDFFERCGYPISFKEAKDKLIADVYLKTGLYLHDALATYFPFLDTKFNLFYSKSKEVSEIIDLMTRCYLREDLRYGGDDRKVFTINLPEHKDKFAFIHRRKVVYSGTFEANDYEDGGNQLVNRKCHVLFALQICDNWYDKNLSDKMVWQRQTDKDYLWIEKSNLKLIHV